MQSANTSRQCIIKRDRGFQPCVVNDGDELFPNGIFEFNVTRLLAFIDAHVERFPVELVVVADIPDLGGSQLNEAAVCAADLSRPILMAEIAPGCYNVIDGHHRTAKARRDGIAAVVVRRVHCPDHTAFLTSTNAYEKYVEYWNSKLKEIEAARSRVRPEADLSGKSRFL